MMTLRGLTAGNPSSWTVGLLGERLLNNAMPQRFSSQPPHNLRKVGRDPGCDAHRADVTRSEQRPQRLQRVRHGPADAPVALTGYAGGLWRKREQLTLEGVLTRP
jgi:hypothetical protein